MAQSTTASKELSGSNVDFGSSLTEKKRIRVAFYLRISTDEEKQDPEKQLIMLRSFAAAKGYDVVERWIVVEETSGWKDILVRPKLYSLMQNSQDYDGILGVRQDRFIRDVAPYQSIMQWLKQTRKFIEFADGSFKRLVADMNEDDEFMAILNMGLSKREVRLTSKRVKQSMGTMPTKKTTELDKGRKWSDRKKNFVGRPRNRVKDNLTGEWKVLDEEEVLRYKEQGWSLRTIADELHCSTSPIEHILKRHGK